MVDALKYRMSINELRIEVLTGVRAHEQKTKQPINIDLDLDIVISGEMILGESIPSYSDIRRGLIKLLQLKHYPLLESLVIEALNWLLNCNGVQGARIKVTKPMALDDALASVSMEGRKKQ